MYSRNLKIDSDSSCFIFGPRGTGKTSWLRSEYPDTTYIDLLEAEMFNSLTGNPQRIETYIPPGEKQLVIIDEVKAVSPRVPPVAELV